jgi:hypothetical protein
MNQEKIKLYLKYNLDLLLKSQISLLQSIEKCKNIDLNNTLTFENQESFDSLTSKFSRVSDILTQKVLKSLIILYREDCKTFIDRANFLEKIGIVQDSNILINIRDLRNEISHEYIEEDLRDLYKRTLEYSGELIILINTIHAHIIGEWG